MEYRSFTNTNTETTCFGNTAATDIIDSIKKASDLLYDGPPLIKVWVGENDFIGRTDYPVIHESSFVEEDKCYIVAGFGIVAGKNEYKKIWDIGFLAVWDENPPN